MLKIFSAIELNCAQAILFNHLFSKHQLFKVLLALINISTKHVFVTVLCICLLLTKL